jgi:sugar phosphate isomerase/epimerase
MILSRTSLRAVVALAATAAVLLLAGGTTAGAAAPSKSANAECGAGRGIPDSQISVQLWTFASFIGFGSDSATQARLEEVLRGLSEMGYRNVEPFSFNGLTAEQFDALLAKYKLKAPSRHGPTDEATWDQTLADAKTIGQHYVGSGGFAAPGIGSYEDVLATAATMNRLGERSVKNGTGPIFGHNHQGEFRTKYVDPETGELKSAWQIIVENTDPRYVVFQVDVLWATDGGADPVELLERFGDRIELLHIKDGINVADPADATPVPLGEGEMDFEPILKAAKGKVRSYAYEQDPPFGDPTYDPFASARAGLEYLDCVTF